MVRHPQAFLMDEPLSNLDAERRVHMRAEIAELHRRLESTFIYVTHDQAEAMTMADRVAVMMDGDLLQVDTPRNIYANPVDIRVAEFIGSPKINILPAQAGQTGEVNIGKMALAGVISTVKNSEIQVGVRPESVTLESKDFPGLACRIVHHENLGSEAYFHVELDSGERVISRMDASAIDQFTTGHEASVKISSKNVLIFDNDGQRIATSNEVVA